MTSYPKIEINYYTKYSSFGGEKEWSSTNFNVSIYRKNDIFPYSTTICFRFKNIAEPLLQYVIPASNFKVYINTNADCENCNLYTSLDSLQAQNSGDACRNIRVSNISDVSINVSAIWQALLIQQLTEADYLCHELEEKNGQNIYFCKLST